jgi:hypothetical protein
MFSFTAGFAAGVTVIGSVSLTLLWFDALSMSFTPNL